MCRSAVQWVNRELQIRGHRFDSGLSQSKKDDRQMADRLTRQQASGIWIRDLDSPDSGIWGSKMTPPIQKSARTPNKLQTLVSHKHTSKASKSLFWLNQWLSPLMGTKRSLGERSANMSLATNPMTFPWDEAEHCFFWLKTSWLPAARMPSGFLRARSMGQRQGKCCSRGHHDCERGSRNQCCRPSHKVMAPGHKLAEFSTWHTCCVGGSTSL